MNSTTGMEPQQTLDERSTRGHFTPAEGEEPAGTAPAPAGRGGSALVQSEIPLAPGPLTPPRNRASPLVRGVFRPPTRHASPESRLPWYHRTLFSSGAPIPPATPEDPS